MPKNLLRLRVQAASSQSFRCFYCQCPMWLADPQPFMVKFGLTVKQARFFQCTAEHLTAQCEGGNNTLANIAAACFHCNHTRHKAAKPLGPAEYQRRVQRNVRRGGWFPGGLTAKVGAGI